MYAERRQRKIFNGRFIDEQRANWRWESHLWDAGTSADIVYTRCQWCGWQPPTEYPLTKETPLCKENPDIKEFLVAHDAHALSKIAERLGNVLRSGLVDVGDIKQCPFCGRLDPGDLTCNFCGKLMKPPEEAKNGS